MGRVIWNTREHHRTAFVSHKDESAGHVTGKGLIRHITPSLGRGPISEKLLMNLVAGVLACPLYRKRVVARDAHHAGDDVRVGRDEVDVGDMHGHVELVFDLVEVLHRLEHLDLQLADDLPQILALSSAQVAPSALEVQLAMRPLLSNSSVLSRLRVADHVETLLVVAELIYEPVDRPFVAERAITESVVDHLQDNLFLDEEPLDGDQIADLLLLERDEQRVLFATLTKGNEDWDEGLFVLVIRLGRRRGLFEDRAAPAMRDEGGPFLDGEDDARAERRCGANVCWSPAIVFEMGWRGVRRGREATEKWVQWRCPRETA